MAAQESASEVKALYQQAIDVSDHPTKERLLRAVLTLAPSHVEARLELTRTLLETGDYLGARTQADSTLNYDRRNPYVWFEKAKAHAFLTDDPAAEKSFARAIRLKGDVPEFYLQLGELHFRRSAWDQALDTFEKALSAAISARNSEARSDAWYWKGRVHSAKKDTSSAIDSFRKALLARSNHKEAGVRLARIEEQVQLEQLYRNAVAAMAQKDWQQAENFLQDILLRNPEFKDVPHRLSIVRNEISTIQRKLVQQSDPPREPGIKLASKTPVNTEPPPAKNDLAVSADSDSTAQGLEVAVTSLVEDSSSQTFGHLPEHQPDAASAPMFSASKSVVWFGGGAVMFLLGLLGWLYSQKRRHAAPNGPKDGTMSASGDAETRTIWPSKNVLEAGFERYQIEYELGHGGMGTVYKALDLRLGRSVALKTIQLNPNACENDTHELIDRFRREAKTTARLNHPNIVSLYDYDESEGVFYMTMEYVAGATLKELLDKNQIFSIERVIWIIRESCRALHYAHEQDLIHRDIKPGNIMISEDGRVKVLDFGIAKMLNLSQTQLQTVLGVRVGSPAYMSPEQIEAEELDRRADIFALGVVFYELLTGKHPFLRTEEALANYAVLFHTILKAEPLLPSSIRKGLAPLIDAILLKMLAKDRNERYHSVSEIIAALARM